MEQNCVSVIIPTYKRTKYIKRAVMSVIKQSYKNLEIVIVDDNMPDSEESIFITHEIKCLDDRIVVIKTQGRVGGGTARNMGVRSSKGAYLAFLDDDDIFMPEKIEKQLSFMLKKKYEMSIQDVEWYNEEEKLIERRTFEYLCDDSPEYMLKQHIIHHLAPTGIYMISRKAFDKTTGFGETPMGQDWRLMLSCCQSGFRIGYMQGVYVHQYLHSGERISLGQNKIDGENSLYEIKKAHMYLLNRKERQYVRFRHYAVLMFGCLRSHFLWKTLKYGVITFLISPFYCMKEAQKYFGNRNHS